MHSCIVVTALNSAADSSTTILLVAPSLVTLLVKGLSYSKRVNGVEHGWEMIQNNVLWEIKSARFKRSDKMRFH